MKKPVQKSSREWAAILSIGGVCCFGEEDPVKAPGLIVHDPDGWDRSNLAKSIDKKITKNEFFRRVNLSTCIPGHNRPTIDTHVDPERCSICHFEIDRDEGADVYDRFEYNGSTVRRYRMCSDCFQDVFHGKYKIDKMMERNKRGSHEDTKPNKSRVKKANIFTSETRSKRIKTKGLP